MVFSSIIMNNLLYLKENSYQTLLYYTDEQIIKEDDYKNFLHTLCLKEYTTLKGRIEAIKELFGFKYNVPIYINDKIILVKIPEGEYNIWINVYNIVSISEVDQYSTNIVFVNNSSLVVMMSKNKVISIVNKGQMIKNKNGLYHEK